MHRSTPRALVAAATLLAALVAGASPALAGGGGRVDAQVVTEDTDTNDGDTPDDVADDGDNEHPSGRDRSVEHGRSDTQGRAKADPDDDRRGPDRSNGGVDQPDGDGGEDLADQDGNNGCGNDDDFEDDNEGWCGRPPHAGPDADAPEDDVEGDVHEDDDDADEDVVAPGGDADGDVKGEMDDRDQPAPVAPVAPIVKDEVLGVVVEAPQADRAVAQPVEAEVLGSSVTRSLGALGAAQQVGDDGITGELPRTGAGLAALALFGLSVTGVGAVVARIGRRDAA